MQVVSTMVCGGSREERSAMHVNWLWLVIVAFLVLCCVPMLFMGRRKRDKRGAGKKTDEKSDGE